MKVVPGAARDAVSGWLGESLKIRVSAAPEKGKANAAVEALLAATLGITERRIRVIQGRTSPHKTIEIVGLSEREVHDRLSKPQ